MAKEATKQQLQNIIATNTDPKAVELAKAQLEQIEKSEGLTSVSAPQGAEYSDEVKAVLAALQNAVRSGGGNVSATDLRKAVNEELDKRKIRKSDLSPDLLSWLSSFRKVEISVKGNNGAVVSKTTTKEEVLKRPLMQKILSDVEANNNVYLYGSAGSGKTAISEQVADIFGWEAITLNCNQFTSPLDILGGQTIEGYQEGKLSMAWANRVQMPDGSFRPIKGAVLILDELPKIDPNTAGILNDALAKIKSYKYDEATNTTIPPAIRNGRNELLPKGNLFIIATGNVALNTIDPDYEANFKQDLSLQDRFIGSTYRVYIDYALERDLMSGYLFIWLYLVKVREKIEELRATGQAFISLRLMLNMKATYETYRNITNLIQVSGLNSTIIDNPKTIIQSMDSFFGLFRPATKDALINDTDYASFKRLVAEKDAMAYSAPLSFDTQKEIEQAANVVKNYRDKNQD